MLFPQKKKPVFSTLKKYPIFSCWWGGHSDIPYEGRGGGKPEKSALFSVPVCVSTLVTMDRAKDGLAEERGGGEWDQWARGMFSQLLRRRPKRKRLSCLLLLSWLGRKEFLASLFPARGNVLPFRPKRRTVTVFRRQTCHPYIKSTHTKLRKKFFFDIKTTKYTGTRIKQRIHRGSDPSQFLTFI